MDRPKLVGSAGTRPPLVESAPTPRGRPSRGGIRIDVATREILKNSVLNGGQVNSKRDIVRAKLDISAHCLKRSSAAILCRKVAAQHRHVGSILDIL